MASWLLCQIKECSTNEDDGIGNKGGELQLDNGVGGGEGLYAVTIDMLGKNINAVPTNHLAPPRHAEPESWESAEVASVNLVMYFAKCMPYGS